MLSPRFGMLGRLRSLVLVPVLVTWSAALVFSCGSDEGTSPGALDGGTAGEGEVPAGQSSGASSGFGGSLVAGAPSGGAPGSVMGGDAGTPSEAGGSTVPSNAGAGGTPLTPEGEQLEVCERLTGVVDHSTKVTRAYRDATIKDCRVTLLIPRLSTGLDKFVQALLIWNLELWGCQGSPVTTFALAKSDAALSAGDAAILIETYLSIAKTELDLSPPELAELQAAVERLAKPAVVSTSTEPSRSNCAVPSSGGAGGEAAGMDPSLAGQGGAP